METKYGLLTVNLFKRNAVRVKNRAMENIMTPVLPRFLISLFSINTAFFLEKLGKIGEKRIMKNTGDAAEASAARSRSIRKLYRKAAIRIVSGITK
jgi:hypothetical protein